MVTDGNGGAVVDDGGLRRRGCTFRKNDFLPEESFRSWGNYGRALLDTPFRFKNRVMTRSMDQTELIEVKSQSRGEMKKTLTWWDLMWFGVGSVIGAGIFVLTGPEAKEKAGPAVVLSYVVSGLSALLSVFCYTKFAVEIPVAGSPGLVSVGSVVSGYSSSRCLVGSCPLDLSSPGAPPAAAVSLACVLWQCCLRLLL